VDPIGEFLHAVTPALAAELQDCADKRSLVLVRDHVGILVQPLVDGALEPRELLASLMGDGAQAAAFAIYLPGRADVVAPVQVGPGDGSVDESDVRRAPVRLVAGATQVGGWRRA
jgi:hypothetical protein